MHKTVFPTCFLIVTQLLVAQSAVADLYRWKDDKGMTTYSDQVPPVESQKGHEILSREAITLRQIAPRKTEAQLAAERTEARKQAAEKQRRDIRDQKDRALRITFANVGQLDRLRDERLELIDSNIKLTRIKLDKMKLELGKAKDKRQAFEDRNKEAPKQLLENIQNYYNQIVFYENQIEVNETRKRSLIERFAVDRARYVQLMSPQDN